MLKKELRTRLQRIEENDIDQMSERINSDIEVATKTIRAQNKIQKYF